MKRMVANKTFKYGTRALRAGDEFDCAREHHQVLSVAGLAVEKPIDKPTERPQEHASPAQEPATKKRSYRRRDMKAEH